MPVNLFLFDSADSDDLLELDVTFDSPSSLVMES